MSFKDIWKELSAIDVNEHTKKKGNLTYLSWTWAWSVLMDHYPEAVYEFGEDKFWPDGSCEVWCTVTIGDHSRSMWLAVMDFKNKSMTKPGSTDIANTRMRCLVKCISMFGLGHYIYAGEDLPNIPKQSYTEAEKERYHELFNDDDGYRFCLFKAFLSDDAYEALTDTFAKGTKTKAKEKLHVLERQGQEAIAHVVDTVSELLANDDPAALEELEGLEDYEKVVLAGFLGKEAVDKINKLKGE